MEWSFYRLAGTNIWRDGSVQLEARQALESFSLQLVCLAIWKEALRVCQAWAEAVGEGGRNFSLNEAGNDEISAANACSLMEQEFAFAVERAEFLASHINTVDGYSITLLLQSF